MEKVYNKLVRDNIPEIIKKDNSEPITRILSDEDYKKELERKLLEEYNEVLNTKTPEERIEELADMLEVMQSLANLENKTLEDIKKELKIENDIINQVEGNGKSLILLKKEEKI